MSPSGISVHNGNVFFALGGFYGTPYYSSAGVMIFKNTGADNCFDFTELKAGDSMTPTYNNNAATVVTTPTATAD